MELSYHHDNKMISSFVENIVKPNEYKRNESKFPFFSGKSETSILIGDLLTSMTKKSPMSMMQLNSHHEKLIMSDGGTVCFHQFLPSIQSDNTPIVFIGATFGGNWPLYESLLLLLVRTFGWMVIVFNRRGAHCELTSPAERIVGCDEDIKIVLDLLHSRYPKSPFFCIGYSAGGCILARFLGKYNPSYVCGLVTISSAVNTGMLDKINPMAARTMLRVCQGRLKKFESKQRKEGKITDKIKNVYNKLYKCADIKKYGEVESELFCESKEDFYQQNSIENWVGKCKIPIIMINAKNDRICTNPELEEYKQKLLEAPNSLYIITDHGSHCVYGSKDKNLQNINWAEFIALSFFDFLLKYKT